MEWHRIAYFVPMVPLRIYSLTNSPTSPLIFTGVKKMRNLASF